MPLVSIPQRRILPTERKRIVEETRAANKDAGTEEESLPPLTPRALRAKMVTPLLAQSPSADKSFRCTENSQSDLTLPHFYMGTDDRESQNVQARPRTSKRNSA